MIAPPSLIWRAKWIANSNSNIIIITVFSQALCVTVSTVTNCPFGQIMYLDMYVLTAEIPCNISSKHPVTFHST